MPVPSDQPRPLAPAAFLRPWMLFVTGLLPQLVLLLLSGIAFWTAYGEMNDQQKHLGWTTAAYLFLLLGVHGGMPPLLRKRGSLGMLAGIVLLVLNAGYLWKITAEIHKIIPASLHLWILPPETVMYQQYALVMPVVFHALLLVFCQPTRRGAGGEVLRSLPLLVGPPAALYLLVAIADSRHLGWEWILVVFLTAGAALMCGGLLRVLALAWRGLREQGNHGVAVLTALVALLGPVGGLALNAKIPFPTDFQSEWIYGLSILNGILLLLPSTGSGRTRRVFWLGQCVMLPFSLYFFLVFLPFLPLSILAVIAMGTGFLMLVPIALLPVHVQTIWPGFVASSRRMTLAGAAAILVLPAVYTLQCLHDRVSLRAAMTHYYNPNYSDLVFRGSHRAALGSLERLRDMKAGLQMPFLGEYYSWLVFDGLVLPDDKIKELYRAFAGREMPPPAPDTMQGMWGRRGLRWSPRRGAPPPTSVALENVTWTETRTNGVVRRDATIVMRNESSAQAEFVGTIRLPEGALVTGFWLDVEGNRVPGRIFERKTAQWVYAMIRDMTRRDPGILSYREPGVVELRVFPFEGHAVRTAGLQVTLPASWRGSPDVVQGKGEELEPGSTSVILWPRDQHTQLAWAGRIEEPDVNPVRREPYLHFLVDCSAAATVDAAFVSAQVDRVLDAFPGVMTCSLSLVNVDTVQPVSGPVDVAKLPDLLVAELDVPRRGAFCIDRAIKAGLIQSHQATSKGDADAWRGVPIFVVLAAPGSLVPTDGDLGNWQELAPDIGGMVWVDGDEAPTFVSFDRTPCERSLLDAQPVVRIGAGTSARVVPWTVAAAGVNVLAAETPWVWDDENRHMKRVASAGDPVTDRAYLVSLDVWRQHLRGVFNPAERDVMLGSLVEASRAANVLLPETSFIVVENTAQWKVLQLKEGQKLMSAEALEHMESPEPETWLLALLLGAWLVFRNARRRRHALPDRRVDVGVISAKRM